MGRREVDLALEDRGRMDVLAELARQGRLSSNEEAELEEFRRCGRLMELLKLKAHQSLRAG